LQFTKLDNLFTAGAQSAELIAIGKPGDLATSRDFLMEIRLS
jgi:hypothetical protein